VFLLTNDFSFCKQFEKNKRKKKKKRKEKRKRKEKKKEKKEKKKKRGHKRISIKAPCNNSNLVHTFQAWQVLFKLMLIGLVNKLG
jgi:hypothetical protein